MLAHDVDGGIELAACVSVLLHQVFVALQQPRKSVLVCRCLTLVVVVRLGRRAALVAERVAQGCDFCLKRGLALRGAFELRYAVGLGFAPRVQLLCARRAAVGGGTGTLQLLSGVGGGNAASKRPLRAHRRNARLLERLLLVLRTQRRV
jgi:hypothetical protein